LHRDGFRRRHRRQPGKFGVHPSVDLHPQAGCLDTDTLGTKNEREQKCLDSYVQSSP